MHTKRVRDFMATHYATVTPDESLAAAVRTILEYHQSAAPVVDNQQQLVGIISEADCMRATLVEGYYNEGVSLVKDLMTEAPEAIGPDVELSEVTSSFLKNNRRIMPVEEAGILVGILSRHDILNALVKEKDSQLHPDYQPKHESL